MIEGVGAAVSEFEVGDKVFGLRAGAQAEYVCVPERDPLAHMPGGITFEEAAAVSDGACIALACLRKAEIRHGRSILIYGASGSTGAAAVQLARHFGAAVTAVCSTKNLELVTTLGADRAIDYTQEGFTQNGETYDVILDAVGKHSFRRCRRSLKPGGVYVETDLGFLWHIPALALLAKWIGDKRVVLPIPKYTKKDILFLKELIEKGRSSIAATRWRTSSRQPATWRPSRRPATSS